MSEPATGAAGVKLSEAEKLAAALGISDNQVDVAGESVKIQPLTINQIGEIMLAVERLAAKGVVLPTADDVAAKGFSAVQIVLRGGQDFKQILAIASEKNVDFIGGLNFVEAARLAGKIWQVNKDFFDQNRLEILQAFGLDEETVDQIKQLAASLKSLLAAEPAASPTSEASPSDNSAASPLNSDDSTEKK